MSSKLPRTPGRRVRLLAMTVVACAAFAGLTSGPVAHADTETVPSLPTPVPHPGHKIEFPTQQEWHAGRGNGHQLGPAGVQAASRTALTYHGGVDGIGVTSGPPQVYLVFWGSQWGAQGTDANNDVTLAGDTAGMAPRLQRLFRGLGTDGELWSGVMTQYCDGPNVAAGAQSCPGNSAHVGYPASAPLAGVWVDESATPSGATEHQLAGEAVAAAAHFGNTTPASNRYAQYVVVSPPGSNPDGFLTSGWCAWHDYNGDTSLTGGAYPSSAGDVAFTNLPSLPEVGQSCGANYVNAGAAGALDGVTIVGGHEYAETLTDQNPSGGWWDGTGAENADKCAWVGIGGAGGAQDVSLATGNFAMQATWSNADAGCRIARAVTTGTTSNTITVTNPGTQTTVVNTATSLQLHGSDSASLPLSYSATNLPAGLSISPAGLISGTPTRVGASAVNVTATDGTGASGVTSFTWNVTSSCASGQKVVNGSFDTGSATPWSISAARILNNSNVSKKEPPKSPLYDAWLGGLGTGHTDTVSQTLTIPAGCTSYPLTFNLHIDTAEPRNRSNDTMSVRIGSTTLASFSNVNANPGYVAKSFNLAAYAGQTVTLTFTATENSSLQTSFVIDDVSLLVS